MSLAFEVTPDDVENVFIRNNISASPEKISDAFDSLDYDEVERAALSEIDFDDQVTAALLEIENQLKEEGFL